MKTHLSQKGLLMNISNVPNLAKKRKHFRVSPLAHFPSPVIPRARIGPPQAFSAHVRAALALYTHTRVRASKTPIRVPADPGQTPSAQAAPGDRRSWPPAPTGRLPPWHPDADPATSN